MRWEQAMSMEEIGKREKGWERGERKEGGGNKEKSRGKWSQ